MDVWCDSMLLAALESSVAVISEFVYSIWIKWKLGRNRGLLAFAQ